MTGRDPLSALEAFLHAQALADWKEAGAVKATAERAAARAEEDFYRLLREAHTDRAVSTKPIERESHGL